MSATNGGVKQERAPRAYVGVGSNVGERLMYLRLAASHFSGYADVTVCDASPVYESKAHTLNRAVQAPDFLNAVIAIESGRSPEDILALCLEVELQAGRDRRVEKRWAPRTLDCDLLVVGSEVRDTPGLRLPHPRLHERRFVLEPLADLAPNLYIPPPHDATVQELLARCPDPNVPRRLRMSLLPPSMTDT